MNLGTLVVVLVLVVIVAAIIGNMVRKKRAGKSINCDLCSSVGTCGMAKEGCAKEGCCGVGAHEHKDGCEDGCPVAEAMVEELDVDIDKNAELARIKAAKANAKANANANASAKNEREG